MKCNKCSQVIQESDQREHYGQILCEDCYMDALSPVRTCDPWAAHAAKSFEKHNNDPAVLNPTQSQILKILKETGGVEPEDLLRRMGDKITKPVLEREFATLKHMEKVRAEQKDGAVFLKIN
ncbi:MAG: hypothetical protein MI863_10805 [Desulfobacterales bacterium]|nr:hypothetical protein [Desulfobacterales bacterium]